MEAFNSILMGSVSTSVVIPTITIGSQIWMAKNVTDNISGSKVYDNNESNRATFGGLYNFTQIGDIETLYPGFRVARIADWNALLAYLATTGLGGSSKQLKATSGWPDCNENCRGEDFFGFGALPTGGYQYGSYQAKDVFAYWMCGDEMDTTNAAYYYIGYWLYDAYGPNGSTKTDTWFPVRLIKN